VVRVIATGVFDILHLGHIYYLEEAKKLGDELVVIVARDTTVRKHKHEPITNEKMRLAMVQALKPVDKAVLGYEKDMYKIIEELKPDIIALGYDQEWNEKKIEYELAQRGLKVSVIRLPELTDDLSGTRKIIRKIIDWHAFQRKIEKVEK
jgi:FAD synthetase